jgi:hypothetical protein
MATYLIDYENVHHSGLDGIKKLTENDYVDIFFGLQNPSIPVDTLEDIIKTPAQIVIKKVKRTADNYLDFQLATYLGHLISSTEETEFFIVSRDRDYEAVQDFWTPRRHNVSIILCESIRASLDDGSVAIPAMSSDSVTGISKVAAKTTAKTTSPTQIEPPKEIRNKIKPIITKKISQKRITGAAHRKTYEIFQAAKKATSNKEHSLRDRLKNEFGEEEGTQLFDKLIDIFDEYQKLV